MISRRLTYLALSGLALSGALGGCVNVLPEPETPKALIELPDSNAAAPQSPLRADVTVYRPDASRPNAGVNIAVRTGQEIVFLNDVRWADAAPRLLQTALLNSLARAEGEGRAVSAEQALRTDYELRWRIVDLSVSRASGEVRAEVEASLVRSATRRIVAQDRFLSVETPEGSNPRKRAAALAIAAQNAAGQVAEFVAQNAAPSP